MSIEALLEAIPSGRPITAVRPMFGTQSDSIRGELWKVGKDRFNIRNGGLTILFSLDDIKSLDTTPCDDGVYTSVIRLKGPVDYPIK